MRFRIASLVSAVATLATLAAGSAAAGQETSLRYRWATGDDVRYRVTVQTDITISGLPGIGVMTMEQNTVQVIRLVVETVADDGTASLRESLESMRMEVRSPIGNIVFDSAADNSTDAMTAVLQAIVSALNREPIAVSVLPSGAVVSVEGMSRVFETLAATLPTAITAAPEFKQIKASLTDEAMQNLFQQSLTVFPDRPVKPGDSWTGVFRTEAPMIGAQTGSQTTTFTGIDASRGISTARLGVTLTSKPAADSRMHGPMGAVLEVADSKSEGEIFFDLARGRVQQSLLKTEAPMKMTMPGPDGTPMTVQSMVRGTMKMEIVEE
jgi:hypothetical protein